MPTRLLDWTAFCVIILRAIGNRLEPIGSRLIGFAEDTGAGVVVVIFGGPCCPNRPEPNFRPAMSTFAGFAHGEPA